MFSLRRVRIRDSGLGVGVTRRNLFYGFMLGYDGGEEAFLKHFHVEQLMPSEMLKEYLEARSKLAYSTSSTSYTTQMIADQYGIDYSGPVRRLTKSSYYNLVELMTALPYS
jgi:hypothetical protein